MIDITPQIKDNFYSKIFLELIFRALKLNYLDPTEKVIEAVEAETKGEEATEAPTINISKNADGQVIISFDDKIVNPEDNNEGGGKSEPVNDEPVNDEPVKVEPVPAVIDPAMPSVDVHLLTGLPPTPEPVGDQITAQAQPDVDKIEDIDMGLNLDTGVKLKVADSKNKRKYFSHIFWCKW
jgi:hypothetical protein